MSKPTPILVLATGQSGIIGISGKSGGDLSTKAGVVTFEAFPKSGQTQGWKDVGPEHDDWPLRASPESNVTNNYVYQWCHELHRRTGRLVCLVLYGAGGQPIAELLPDGSDNISRVGDATGFIYKHLQISFDRAIHKELPGFGKSLFQLGIRRADYLHFNQGEADADYKSDPKHNSFDPRSSSATLWLRRFNHMIQEMKAPTGTGWFRLIDDNTQIIVSELLHHGTGSGKPGVGASTDDRNNEINLLQVHPFIKSRRQISILETGNLQLWASSGDVRGTHDFIHFNGRALEAMATRGHDCIGYVRDAGYIPIGNWACVCSQDTLTAHCEIKVNSKGSVTLDLPTTSLHSKYNVSCSEDFARVKRKTNGQIEVENLSNQERAINVNIGPYIVYDG